MGSSAAGEKLFSAVPASHGNVTVNVDLVSVGCNPIEQGVRNTTTAKLCMPAGNGDLRAEDGRGVIFIPDPEKNEQILLLFRCGREKQEVIKDHQRNLSETLHRFIIDTLNP